MKNEQLSRQRSTLLYRLEQLLEGPMIFLGFVWLILLVIELIWGLTPLLEIISITIWIVFIIDFLLKLFLAPKKLTFLKKNWLTIISLIIPALRVVRFFRIARLIRGLRSVRLIKVVSSLNRSMGSLNATMKRRGFKYVIAITVFIIFAGAAGMYAFEKEGLESYGESLWWTTMLLTSIGSEYWPVTPEGKALCILLSIYGFCVFGYITATLASFFVGRDAEEKDAPVAGSVDIAALRKEIEKLNQSVKVLLQRNERGN